MTRAVSTGPASSAEFATMAMWGRAFLSECRCREVVLLSSCRSVGRLGGSALRHVMSCDDLQLRGSTDPFFKVHKGSFCCSKNKPRDANLFCMRLRGQGVNFPECLCPEDFLLVPLLLELVGRQRRLYLLTAQGTSLPLWKKERKEEEEKMARGWKAWFCPSLHKPATLPNNAHIPKGLQLTGPLCCYVKQSVRRGLLYRTKLKGIWFCCRFCLLACSHRKQNSLKSFPCCGAVPSPRLEKETETLPQSVSVENLKLCYQLVLSAYFDGQLPN